MIGGGEVFGGRALPLQGPQIGLHHPHCMGWSSMEPGKETNLYGLEQHGNRQGNGSVWAGAAWGQASKWICMGWSSVGTGKEMDLYGLEQREDRQGNGSVWV